MAPNILQSLCIANAQASMGQTCSKRVMCTQGDSHSSKLQQHARSRQTAHMPTHKGTAAKAYSGCFLTSSFSYTDLIRYAGSGPVLATLSVGCHRCGLPSAGYTATAPCCPGLPQTAHAYTQALSICNFAACCCTFCCTSHRQSV